MKLEYAVLTLVSCWCFPAYAIGQELPWPRDPHGVEYRVESSYGPRNLGGEPGTFFHKGIDLNGRNLDDNNGDKNYPLFAAAYGDIFGVGRASSGLKWIGINYGAGRSFAYLHIFPDETATSKGTFVGIPGDAEIKSYRRIYTDDDPNRGVILFYSGPDNTGKIVKALGIKDFHVEAVKAAKVCGANVTTNCDAQVFHVHAPTPSTDTVVVSAGDGILETIPQGDDKYSEDGMSIVAGINNQCDSKAGYVIVHTSVAPNEVVLSSLD